MQFSQVRCCCLLLGSKNSAWHSVFKHPHTIVIHLTVRFAIPHSYKLACKYIYIISVDSVKTSVNFLKMQLNTKNSIAKQNCKINISDFCFNTRVLQKKSHLTYHTIRVFVLFGAIFCFINHIYSKLTTFTP